MDQSLTLEKEDAHHAWLKVGAGKNWHDWVLQSIQYGHGLENLALIPGTVGAAPVQNIGAYGVEVADFIARCRACASVQAKKKVLQEKTVYLPIAILFLKALWRVILLSLRWCFAQNI